MKSFSGSFHQVIFCINMHGVAVEPLNILSMVMKFRMKKSMRIFFWHTFFQPLFP